MRAYLLRHGETGYRQGNASISLAEASDLTSNGEEDVFKSAANLGMVLSQGTQGRPAISIHSSPTGRTLHTARLARDTLQQKDIVTVGEIKVNQDLREVDNFDWSLFSPLVTGGDVSYDSEQFTVDPSLTNPRGLSIATFFRSDAHLSLPANARASLPQAYVTRLEIFEPYRSVVERLHGVLASLQSQPEHHLLAVHEGGTGDFVEALAGSKDAYLVRGRYITLEGSDHDWAAVSAQDGAIGQE